jgi:hypothetical protein
MHSARAMTVLAATAVAAADCPSGTHQAQTLATPSAATHSAIASSAAPAVNLNSDLLAVTNLPAGWTTTPASSGSSGVASCKALDPGSRARLPQHAEADFAGGPAGPFLSEELATRTNAQVATTWSAFAAAASQCASFTQPDSSGGTTAYTLEGMSFPSYGDATYAFGVTATSDGVGVSGDIVAVRKGDVLAEVIAIGLAGVPVATVEDVVSKAVGKA